ncbi:MAG: DUF2785 domain-containing protein [Henriciella sp.]
MKSLSLIVALSITLTACASTPAPAHSEAQLELSSCAFTDNDREALEAIRANKFADQQSDAAAEEFASCLGSPDPFFRDKIGYEGLMTALRSGAVSEQARLALISEMLHNLNDTAEPGFLAPFSALALSELVRTDRVEAFLSEEERADIANQSAVYLTNVTDFRAYSDTEGWRHGVAHGADIALQLALNPNTDEASLRALRDAIAAQITARSGHAFTYGEPERLARPILFMASRNAFEAEDWTAWFAELSEPAPLAEWGDAFQSEIDLARLHNLKSFAQVLYINASLSSNENLKPIADEALNMLKALP